MLDSKEINETIIREALGRLFDALGHPTRILLLRSIKEGKSVVNVANQLDITRGALQAHIQKLMEADLIWQDLESSQGYLIQPLGEQILRIIKRIPRELRFDHLLPQLREIEARAPKVESAEETQARARAVFGFSVSEKFLEKALKGKIQKEKNEVMKRVFQNQEGKDVET